MTARRRAERGQSTILLVAIMLVMAAIGGAILELGAEEVRRGRLQAMADVTALAAVRGDADAAMVAARNGVAVRSIERLDDGTVTVIVESDGRRAVAAAQA